MAEITIRYDARNAFARKMVDFMLSFDVFELKDKKQQLRPRYNKETEKAIQEAKDGQTTPISLSEFRKQL